MNTSILREAEADLAELARLPGAIRDKVKAGVAELRRLHDAIDAELARLTGAAKATLDSLQAFEPEPDTTGGDAHGPEGGALPPPPADRLSADADKPPLTF